MKRCTNCQSPFEINDQDHAFYKKIDVPPPTLCPFCRQNRRLAHRNERVLYQDTCDLCGKAIISMFHPESEYTVYCNDCWHSDKWDPLNYGRDYDPNRPFFEQFNELQKEIPFFALHQDKNSENCSYVNYGIGNKNCYLAFCVQSEDVYYSYAAIQSRNSMDCHKVVGAELCYECVDCVNSYKVLFSQDSQNCQNSLFLKDCVNVKSSFCCVGLRNKEFCFMNQQLTEEDYKKKMAEIKFTHESIEEWRGKLDMLSIQIPKKHIHGVNNENVTGDYIDACKNLKDCFDCVNGVESMAYSHFCALKCRDSYDLSNAGLGVELCYESISIVGCTNCKGLYYSNYLQDSEYSQCCFSSDHLWGCIGLKHKSYHILNKPYSPDEYEKLRAQIVENMKRDGEYGEFFPVHLSKFAYNETTAHEYDPISKEEALKKGYTWRDRDIFPQKNVEGALTCENCSRAFRAIHQELEFYKRLDLPLPKLCHDCRHKRRFLQRNPRQLWDRRCDHCGKEIRTSYEPERPEKVYCETCYLKEVY